MTQHDLWVLLVIAGLTVVTVVTRGFFFMSSKPWHLPTWAQRGLQYAPIAALSAVIAPEVFMSQGQVISTLQDARIYAAIIGAGVFFWKRNVLWTIVGGMGVYLPLHLSLGW